VTVTQQVFNSDPAIELEQAVKNILTEVLGLGQRGAALTADTALLGGLPELDSMAVATVLTALEEKFDILIDDGELSAETFDTLGSLTQFVHQLITARKSIARKPIG
jgi:acyl carrier protein